MKKKTEWAINTIRFIESQIIKTQDSLENIENKLKDFKEENPNLEIFDKEFGTFFSETKN